MATVAAMCFAEANSLREAARLDRVYLSLSLATKLCVSRKSSCYVQSGIVWLETSYLRCRLEKDLMELSAEVIL